MTVRSVILALCLFALIAATSQAEDVSKLIVKPTVETHRLGGVDVPDAGMLRKMHASQYVLRAAGGKLTKVPVGRVLLPHSDSMNPQAVQVDIAGDGTVYVRQSQILCKSTDGGKTWTAKPIRTPKNVNLGFRWKVLRDGTLINVGCAVGKKVREPATVWASKDEGATWSKRAEIPLDKMPLPSGKPYKERYTHRGLNRLQDDTLIWGIDIRDDPYENGFALYFFRSTDGGRKWEGPLFISDRGASEGGTVLLPSGRVFATVRMGRWVTAFDTPLLRKYTQRVKAAPYNGRHRIKNLFVMDSDNGGRTWNTPRLLCTVFGQCFGYPAVQSDGTVIVIHDTRYGPGPPGSRAMISRDEGKTWRDEVYYLDSTKFTGSYSASVVLKDDTILTIAGSSQSANSWEAVRNTTDLYAIRWKPVKD